MGTPWTRRVPRIITRPTENLPQTTDKALFRITGGKVRILEIVGEVTTVMQADANNTKLKHNPSGVGADVDLCAVLDVNADAVGTLYSITGDFSDAMADGLWSLETDETMEKRGIILGPGDIELDCAASRTGQVKWTLNYELVDEGANIALA
jgi:hypothetical protein